MKPLCFGLELLCKQIKYALHFLSQWVVDWTNKRHCFWIVKALQTRPNPLKETSQNVNASKLSSRSRLFVDTAGYDAEEKIDPVSCSLFNQGEASIVKNIIFNLTQLGLLPDQIAILTPYNAQKTLLRQNHPKYTVETINAFQGQEAEVVICSFVRSNPDNNLGFVADRRRLTVALTRARRLWIGIGDSSLLASNEYFAELFDLLGEDLLSAWEELSC